MATKKHYDIEVGFISKYLETKDTLLVKDMQIKRSFFSGDNKLAFDFILNHQKETGEIPSVRVFERRFPHYKLEKYTNANVVGTEESLQFWCTELRKKVKHNTIVNTLEEVGDLLQDLDTDKAYSLLKTALYRFLK